MVIDRGAAQKRMEDSHGSTGTGRRAPCRSGHQVFPTQKPPIRGLVIPPRPGMARLSDIGAARQFFAA
jgi:hypothetical protein